MNMNYVINQHVTRKRKNIESLTGFEHMQFSIYTVYVPNEKTQIPCWLCPVLFPQLVYFQKSVNGMWWPWLKEKNIEAWNQ